jgi:hypothetical protein
MLLQSCRCYCAIDTTCTCHRWLRKVAPHYSFSRFDRRPDKLNLDTTNANNDRAASSGKSTHDDNMPAVVVSHGLQYTQIVPVHTAEAGDATTLSGHTHTVRYVVSAH